MIRTIVSTIVAGCIAIFIALVIFLIMTYSPVTTFENTTSHNVLIVLVREDIGECSSYDIKIGPNVKAPRRVLEGQYILLYRTDKEFAFTKGNIEIGEEDTLFKIIDSGEDSVVIMHLRE